MISFLKRSEFTRNVATVMSGTVLAQILPMLTSPIMTRIFSPTDYGILGLYMAISGTLNIVVTSQYNHAIMLPDGDDDSINIIGLCVAISAITSVLVLCAILLMGKPLGRFFGIEAVGIWLYFLPLSVVMSGCFSALSYWTNRHCKFKRLAVSRLFQAVIIIAIQIIFGLLCEGPTGLLLGLLSGQAVSTVVLLYQVWLDDRYVFMSNLAYRKMIVMAKAHRSFAIYQLPADFMYTINNLVPTFLLSRFVGNAQVGTYNFTQRILGLPSSLVSSALLDVFKQRSISDYNKLGNCRDIYVKTFKTLAVMGLIPLIVILFTAPGLFSLVFGDKWREAGVYAQILSFMFYLRFVINPLTYLYYIVGKQKEDLIIHIVMLLGTLCSLYLGYYLYKSPKYMIFFYSISYSFIYLFYLIRSYMFSKGYVATDRMNPQNQTDHAEMSACNDQVGNA